MNWFLQTLTFGGGGGAPRATEGSGLRLAPGGGCDTGRAGSANEEAGVRAEEADEGAGVRALEVAPAGLPGGVGAANDDFGTACKTRRNRLTC